MYTDICLVLAGAGHVHRNTDTCFSLAQRSKNCNLEATRQRALLHMADLEPLASPVGDLPELAYVGVCGQPKQQEPTQLRALGSSQELPFGTSLSLRKIGPVKVRMPST